MFRDWVNEDDGMMVEQNDKLQEKLELDKLSFIDKEHIDEVKALIFDFYEQIRDFYYELASLDKHIYPWLNMSSFANICLTEGVGNFKAQIRPEKEAPQGLGRKTKSSNSPSPIKLQKQKSMQEPAKLSRKFSVNTPAPIPEEDEKLKGLFTDDLKKSIMHLMDKNDDAPNLAPGETLSGSNELWVNFHGFIN